VNRREPSRPVPGAVSVTELSAAVREAVVQGVGWVTVFGEISNFKAYGQGNWYFTLKDAESQLRAVMFSRDRRFMKYRPKDGDEVLVRGRVDVYGARGDLQVIVERMKPLGAGQLQEQFERLKQRLRAEGLFDAARKQRLPAVPRRIGIVTSLQAAALQDMLRTLDLRDPTLAITIAPARVQGDGAGQTIAAALDLLNRASDVDVILLGRGGGSLEDLWAFNEEVVARAVARSRVPVICGVGHETDATIAEFVADLRAPTPTGAAERAVPIRRDLEAAIADLRARLVGGSRRGLERRLERTLELRQRLLSPRRRLEIAAQRLDDASGRLERALRVGMDARGQRLDGLTGRLRAQDPRAGLDAARGKLAVAEARLHQAALVDLRRRRERLEARRRQLGLVGPLQSLERGYALASHEGRLVRRPSDVAVGGTIDVRLHGGALRCNVASVIEDTELDLMGRPR